MFPFERLLVWQRAHRFAVDLYARSAEWPDRELQVQIRRAAQSVAAIIAEGAGCESQGQFARYLGFAQASSSEVRNHLRFAREIGTVSPDAWSQLDEAMQEIRKMLHALRLRVLAQRQAETKRGAPDSSSRPASEQR